jgi:transcriptional repressor NrdR
MVCPFCLHKKTETFNSRAGTRLNTIWRRRRCPQCGAQFTTYETADPSSVLSVKKGRHIVPFSHSKLLLELTQVCDHRDNIDKAVPYLADTIEQKLFRAAGKLQRLTLSPDDIFATASETLQRYDPVAYVKYIGRHQKNVNAATLRKALKKK